MVTYTDMAASYLLNTSAYTLDKSSSLRQEPESGKPTLTMNSVNVETGDCPKFGKQATDFGPTLNKSLHHPSKTEVAVCKENERKHWKIGRRAMKHCWSEVRELRDC